MDPMETSFEFEFQSKLESFIDDLKLFADELELDNKFSV